MMGRKFGITLKAKLRHAALSEAAEKCGGQAALAAYIGVEPQDVCGWIAMKRCPPVTQEAGEHWRYRGKWSEGRVLDLEKKLFELTGQTLDELFPPELRENHEFLRSCKSIERTREIDCRLLASPTLDRLMLPSPVEAAEADEVRSAIAKAMKTLTYREREIIKLRYGLGDGRSYTLEEVGHVFKVTRDRIRQIEVKALQKLQSRKVMAAFGDAVPNTDCLPPITENDWEQYRQWLNRKPTMVEPY